MINFQITYCRGNYVYSIPFEAKSIKEAKDVFNNWKTGKRFINGFHLSLMDNCIFPNLIKVIE